MTHHAPGATWFGMLRRSAAKSAKQHPFDELISATQKYLRRREHDKMLYCVLEIVTSWSTCESTEPINNLINRLLIMAGEEMLFVETQRIERLETIASFCRPPTVALGGIVSMCKILLGARLCRLPSDYRHYFWRREEAAQEALAAIENQTENLHVFHGTHTHPKVDGWLTIFDRLLGRGAANEQPLMYLLFAIHHAKDADDKPSRFTSRCAYTKNEKSIGFLWEILDRHAGAFKTTVRTYYNLFNVKREEDFVFLVNALLLVMHKDNVALPGEPLLCLTDVTARQMAAEHIAKPFMELDDYCIDMHTARGRRMGKGAAEFATEGAVVVDEDTVFLNPEYRGEYIRFKQTQGKKHPTTKKRHAPAEAPTTPTKAAKTGRDEPPNQKALWAKAKSARREQAAVSLARPGTSFTHKKLVVSGLCPELDLVALVGQIPAFCNGGNVCGQKGVTIHIRIDGRDVAIKEVTAATQYGCAAFVLDGLKTMLGLASLNPRLFHAPRCIRRLDTTNKSFVNNWCWVNKPTIYLANDYISGHTLQSLPQWHTDSEALFGYFRVVVMRAVFACSDTNACNAMVRDGDNEVHSIDEARILEGAALRRVLGKTNRATRARWMPKVATSEKYRTFLRHASALNIDALVQLLAQWGYQGEANRAFLTDRLEHLSDMIEAELRE